MRCRWPTSMPARGTRCLPLGGQKWHERPAKCDSQFCGGCGDTMRRPYRKLLIWLVLVTSSSQAFAQADTGAICRDQPLSVEAASNDKQQIDLMLRQATAGARAQKPERAIALLSGIIRPRRPTPSLTSTAAVRRRALGKLRSHSATSTRLSGWTPTSSKPGIMEEPRT